MDAQVKMHMTRTYNGKELDTYTIKFDGGPVGIASRVSIVTGEGDKARTEKGFEFVANEGGFAVTSLRMVEVEANVYAAICQGTVPFPWESRAAATEADPVQGLDPVEAQIQAVAEA